LQADGTSLTRSEVSEIREKGFGQFGETKRGNIVIVDFTFTNNSSEAVTLDSASLSLIDSSGNKSEVDPEYSSYVLAKKDIFLENVNPRVLVKFMTPPSRLRSSLSVSSPSPSTSKRAP
jgi:hypothetical protein